MLAPIRACMQIDVWINFIVWFFSTFFAIKILETCMLTFTSGREGYAKVTPLKTIEPSQSSGVSPFLELESMEGTYTSRQYVIIEVSQHMVYST